MPTFQEKTADSLRKRIESSQIARRYDLAGIGLILPVVVTFIFVTVIPVAYGIWLSLHQGQGATNLSWVGLNNYSSLLESPEFFRSIRTGVVYAVYSVVFQVVFGTIIALSLNKIQRFASVIRAFIFVPYMIPTVAAAVVFKMMMNAQIGIINWFLHKIGIINSVSAINWFGTEFAMHSVVWGSIWRWTIFVVILVLARLHSIDQTLYDMAKTNGASTYRQFVDITYPNIKSVLFLAVLLRSIWMFNKFDMIWLLTQGGPLSNTTTMVVLAYKEGFQQFSFGSAAAITTMMFILLMMFGIGYFKLFSPEDEVEVTQG